MYHGVDTFALTLSLSCAQLALVSCFALCMFLFMALILKFQTLTDAVQGSLTGQLAKDFAIDPSTNVLLLHLNSLGLTTIACSTESTALASNIDGLYS